MRYTKALAQKYRKNGYLFIARDIYTGAFDIFHQTVEGRFPKVQTEWTKSEAVREAKRLSMEKKLGFNPEIDIIV